MKIARLDQLAGEPVSHAAGITKKVLLRLGDIPHLTQFAQAVVPPGEFAPAHAHPDMVEVFLTESGAGTILIDGRPQPLAPGTCVTVEPGEEHEVRNTGEIDLVLTYFGVEA